MVRRIGVVFCVLLVWPGGVQAGQSRADLLTAQREAKSRAARPVPATGLEGFLLRAADGRWPSRLLNPRSGLFLRVGLPGEGAGLGIGPAWRHSPFDRRYTVTTSFAASASRNWSGQVTVEVPDLLSSIWTDRVGLQIGAGRHQRARDAFWGIGPDADQRSVFALAQRDVMGTVTVRLSPALHLGMAGGVLSSRPEGQSESLGGRVTHARVGASMAFDQRNTLPPTRTGRHLEPEVLDGASTGRLVRVDWSRFSDTGTGAFSFDRTSIDVQQYLPFLHGHRLLAFRALAVLTTADDGATVPFYLLPTVGGSRVGRAYPTFRFRDRHLLAAQAEYRYIVNPFMHGAVFVDAAQVAPRLDALTWAQVRWSGGVGLRIGVRGGAAFRVDVAYGRDGLRLATGLGHAF